MTPPKKKAKKIFNLYLEEYSGKHPNANKDIAAAHAKAKSLIEVEETIVYSELSDKDIIYFQKVKQELNKL